jgi:hypothetical protein
LLIIFKKRGDKIMGKIMIKCPVTGKAVFTGIGTDKKSFDDPSNTFENNSIHCPHCMNNHVWSKKDAYWEQ